MYTEQELKVFEIIDKYLQNLELNNSNSVYDIGEQFWSPESQMAYKILCDKDLIHFRGNYQDTKSIIDIAPNGVQMLKIGGYKKYLDTLKEQADHEEYAKNLEIEKTKTDLDLARKMLKEYPYTKWFARIGFVIALGLGLLELIRFLKER